MAALMIEYHFLRHIHRKMKADTLPLFFHPDKLLEHQDKMEAQEGGFASSAAAPAAGAPGPAASATPAYQAAFAKGNDLSEASLIHSDGWKRDERIETDLAEESLKFDPRLKRSSSNMLIGGRPSKDSLSFASGASSANPSPPSGSLRRSSLLRQSSAPSPKTFNDGASPASPTPAQAELQSTLHATLETMRYTMQTALENLAFDVRGVSEATNARMDSIEEKVDKLRLAFAEGQLAALKAQPVAPVAQGAASSSGAERARSPSSSQRLRGLISPRRTMSGFAGSPRSPR